MSQDKRVTLYNSNAVAQYQTIATTVTSQQSDAILADRILITSAVQTHFVAFGSNPSATTTTNTVCIPANTTLMFEFTSNNKVAVKTLTSTGHISIVALDSTS
jgi:hypothetical protein